MAVLTGSTQGVTATTYDLVPYRSHSFPQSHPDRLFVVGRLLGLDPAAVETASVLELGCASGGNLLPMAEQLPGGSFIGIDMSSRQIAHARAVAEASGLENVAFEVADIAKWDPGERKFDYIVMHGVFSWVPDAVQRRSLGLIQSTLKPKGIAFVSYNAYPGWHMRGVVRGMATMHASRYAEPKNKVAAARALIDFLQSAVDKDSAYGRLLASEAATLLKGRDDYVFHEHLEDHNQPFYLLDFLKLAEGAGLQFLGEANFSSMITLGLPKNVADTLTRMSGGDPRLMEQYLDFVRNTYFRQTLLVPASAKPHRKVTAARLNGLYVGGSLTREPEKDADGVFAFKASSGQSVTLKRAATAAALEILAEAMPDVLPVEEVAKEASKKAGEDAKAGVLSDILELYARGFLDLRPRPLGFARTPPSRPLAGPATRAAATRGEGIANRRHEPVQLGGLARNVLALCDGTRDADGIVTELVARASNGEITVRNNGEIVSGEDTLRSTLAPQVTALMPEFARRALFVVDEAPAE